MHSQQGQDRTIARRPLDGPDKFCGSARGFAVVSCGLTVGCKVQRRLSFSTVSCRPGLASGQRLLGCIHSFARVTLTSTAAAGAARAHGIALACIRTPGAQPRRSRVSVLQAEYVSAWARFGNATPMLSPLLDVRSAAAQLQRYSPAGYYAPWLMGTALCGLRSLSSAHLFVCATI